MLLGGSGLYFLGSPRPTLDVDFAADERQQDELQITMQQVADEMNVEIEECLSNGSFLCLAVRRIAMYL
jgi:hypothetical protein